MQHFGVLMILEMLCINLYISHICLDRRASPAAAVSVLAVFTLLVWGVSVAVMGASPEYGDGGFVVLGFIYLLPLNYLYRRGVKTTLSVMFLAWSYTMLVFIFSRCLGQLAPEHAQAPAMLAVQTAVYVLTLRAFLRLLHEKLLCVIGQAGPDRGNMLFRLGLSTCALAFCTNWMLQSEDVPAGIVADGEAGGAFPAQGEDSELWGFAREDGSWWVEPVFSQAPSPLREGLACALDPEGWGIGYLDGTGAWAIEPQFYSAGNFSEGLAAAKDASGLFGYVDASGEWAIEPSFAEARPFHEGLAAVSTPELDESGNVARYAWGYVGSDGSWAIEPTYYGCTSFSGGLAAVATGAHSWQLVDADGNVLPGELPGVNPQGFSAGLCALADPVTELWGYVDTEGSLIIEQGFSSCHPFVDTGYSERVAPAKDRSTGLWGIIDETGGWVAGATPRFVEMGEFSCGAASDEGGDKDPGEWLAPAKSADGNLWGLVNRVGTWVVEPRFASVRY